jgi:hypothetical protein
MQIEAAIQRREMADAAADRGAAGQRQRGRGEAATERTFG